MGAEPSLFMGRGYTGHEHLQWFNLVNMNGRLYDPVLGRMLSPDNYVQSPDYSQGYNRYAYCYNNPLKFSDPDGDLPFLVIAAYFVVNAAIDYGMQVAFNYAAGYKGKDAWFSKVDFFDTVVSGGIGAITAGYGTAAKLAEKSGKTLSKFGTFVIKNPELIALGHTVITSGADITGEGWQPVSFDDFAKRAVVSALTYYGSKELIKVGYDILSKKGQNVAVLGHYPDYVDLAEQLNAKRFQIPTEVWNKMTPMEQWSANQKFLDELILGGDKIRLATPINKVKVGSFFEKELKYFFDKGYKISSDGLWLKK